ncbi:hypothetical protein C8J56DRAFT_197442 [Mycena floridula]|nr:hypothetical protein C8J56DRAFT_197442 [Mycena floridula]
MFCSTLKSLNYIQFSLRACRQWHFPLGSGAWTALDAALDDLASPTRFCSYFHRIQRPDDSGRLSLPLFQNVTHMELDVSNLNVFDGRRRDCLQNLTHFSLVHMGLPYPVFLLADQLHLRDSIIVCILFYGGNHAHVCVDPRVVMASDQS